MKKLFLCTIVLLLAAASAQAVEVSNPAPGFFVNFGNNSFQNVMVQIINILLGLAGLVALLYLIIGGFQYIMSGGNEDQAKIGRKRALNAIVGLIIIILSYTIVSVVYRTLSN